MSAILWLSVAGKFQSRLWGVLLGHSVVCVEFGVAGTGVASTPIPIKHPSVYSHTNSEWNL